MSNASLMDLSDQYAEKFDNLADVSHPSIAFNPRFDKLMQEAIDRGTPLTEQEVEAEFGKLEWEW